MSNPPIEIMVGKQYTECVGVKTNKTKAIVFDLDETIGHFTNLNQLHKVMEELLGRTLVQTEFDKLMDMYPEFLRPGILTILEFLEYKKKQGTLHKVYLYTNNQCGKRWVDCIISYINAKINSVTGLFDDTIYAFKIKNRIIDIRRTTNNKTHEDLIKCTLIKDATTELCFVDDKKYTQMYNDNVYYVKPRPYVHSMTKQEIIMRLMENVPVSIAHIDKGVLQMELQEHCTGQSNRGSYKIECDNEITRKIMYHVREYLYFNGQRPVIVQTPKEQTYKNRKMYPVRNKTLKKHPKSCQKN